MRFAYPRRVLTVLPGGQPNPHSVSTPPRAISTPPEPVAESPRGRLSGPDVSVVDNFEPEEPLLAAHYATRT